jgi:GT2 family glycosyltransferase
MTSDLPTPPALSILMVNWNTREMTLACLRSLYAQTERTPFEVILVDNGSADGSAEAIAREFPQVRLIAESENHGFAKATNMAAEAARGRYLLLLNTDTIVLDQAIDRLVEFAAAHPAAGIWGGRTLFADGSLNPTSCWARITPWSTFCFAVGLSALAPRSALFNPEGLGGWARDSMRQVDIVSGCFFLIEADRWRALGGFDPAFFMYGEEADLCARARAAGARPLITPDAAIIHYGGASAVKRANTISYIFGARIGLVRRQLSGVGRAFAWAMSVLTVWWRATLYGLAARLAPGGRFATPASEWSETWRRRADWRDGPVKKGA